MAFTYAVVDSFSIVFLLILFGSTRDQSSGLRENRCFRAIVLMTVVALISDMVAWQFDGRPGMFARYCLWISNICGFVLSGVMSLGWLFYVSIKINRDDRLPRPARALICLPCLFLTVVSLLTPWTHWMFNLDANNVYQRGGLFFIQTIIPFAYLFAAALFALIQARRERLRQQRWECLCLVMFIVFPIIGGILQIAVYGLSFAWPCTALSLMLVYVNLQSQKISLDALTGLNNRGQFDKYLYGCMDRSGEDSAFALFMLDIDNFKKINDQLGHTAGDAALIAAAKLLTNAFAETNAFVARYGGDEFAVVLHYAREPQVLEAYNRIADETDAYNARNAAQPYKLVFSIGYVCGDRRRFTTYQDMITAADAHMYLQKQQHKAIRA